MAKVVMYVLLAYFLALGVFADDEPEKLSGKAKDRFKEGLCSPMCLAGGPFCESGLKTFTGYLSKNRNVTFCNAFRNDTRWSTANICEEFDKFVSNCLNVEISLPAEQPPTQIPEVPVRSSTSSTSEATVPLTNSTSFPPTSPQPEPVATGGSSPSTESVSTSVSTVTPAVAGGTSTSTESVSTSAPSTTPAILFEIPAEATGAANWIWWFLGALIFVMLALVIAGFLFRRHLKRPAFANSSKTNGSTEKSGAETVVP